MRILISGERGYLGAAVAARLRAEGYEVAGLPCRLEQLEPVSLEADLVVHAAAQVRRSGEPDSAELEALTRAVNVQGTARLLAALRHPAPFIFLSSRAVYGDEAWPYPRVSEATPVRPGHFYGQSKLDAEQRVRESGLSHVILRSGTLYGLSQGNPGRSFINRILCAGLERGELVLLGGEQMVDLLHVDDLADLIALCCRDWPGSRIFNVGGPAFPVSRWGEWLAQAIMAKRELVIRRLDDGRIPHSLLLDCSAVDARYPGWRRREPPSMLPALVAHFSTALGRS